MTSGEYRDLCRAPILFGMEAFASTPRKPGTLDGARGACYAVVSAVLITCRPVGTQKYTYDQMVQRAAACASSPDGFMALFRELVLSASAPPARPEQEGDRPVSDCLEVGEESHRDAVLVLRLFGFDRPPAQVVHRMCVHEVREGH